MPKRCPSDIPSGIGANPCGRLMQLLQKGFALSTHAPWGCPTPNPTGTAPHRACPFAAVPVAGAVAQGRLSRACWRHPDISVFNCQHPGARQFIVTWLPTTGEIKPYNILERRWFFSGAFIFRSPPLSRVALLQPRRCKDENRGCSISPQSHLGARHRPECSSAWQLSLAGFGSSAWARRELPPLCTSAGRGRMLTPTCCRSSHRLAFSATFTSAL